MKKQGTLKVTASLVAIIALMGSANAGVRSIMKDSDSIYTKKQIDYYAGDKGSAAAAEGAVVVIGNDTSAAAAYHDLINYSNQTSAAKDYYDWVDSFDWESCGVQKRKRFNYVSQCERRQYVRPSCVVIVPVAPVVFVTPIVPVIPAENATTNQTIPVIPSGGAEQNATNQTICTTCTNTTIVTVINCTNTSTIIPPSGNVTPPVVVENCTNYKVCRSRSQCQSDHSWWSYWGMDGGQASGAYDGYGHKDGCGCDTCGCHIKKVPRKRICNATMDSSFDYAEFLSNSTYYGGCDCAIFRNCTEIIPQIPETPIPVPPLPPSGS